MMLDKENFSINSTNMFCINAINTTGREGKIHLHIRNRASQILDQLSSGQSFVLGKLSSAQSELTVWDDGAPRPDQIQ
jgi:hypothetical protein